MAIIRITKEQVKKANAAREAALSKNPEFKAFEEEIEKEREKALKEEVKEGAS